MKLLLCLLGASRSFWRSVRAICSGGMLLCFSTLLPAQTVSFSGAKSSVDFGNVNLCGPESKPAPCSETLSLNYKVTAGGTLGDPNVLTLGSPDLDFTLADGSTCSGSVNAATTCTVKVQFTPRFAGGRIGAVQITNKSGKPIATTPIYGSGIGPQIAATLSQSQYNGALPFSPANSEESWVYPRVTALNGAGDIFGVGTDVEKLPSGGGSRITLYNPTDSYSNGGLTIDGAGDVFFTRTGAGVYLFTELPSGDGAAFNLLTGTLQYPGAVAADGAGDVFVTSSTIFSTDVLELPAQCRSNDCATTAAHVISPDSIHDMAADANGNLFLLQYNNDNGDESITKLPAGGGSPTLIFNKISDNSLALQCLTVDGADNLYAVATLGKPYTIQTNAILEFPAGSGTYKNVYSLGVNDDLETPSYSLAADASGNMLLNDSYTTDDDIGIYNNTSLFQRSQFAPLNFGSVAVGRAKTLPLEVDNIGNRPLVLKPMFTSPSYTVLGANPEGCLSGTGPAHSCTLSIQFRPLTAGPHTIQFTLGSNGAADSVLLLQGAGTD